MSSEYIFEINDALYDHETGEVCMKPKVVGALIRCKDCKLNPKYEWFGCPMSHLSEKQRPETAWCWKAERRNDG